MVKIMGFFIWPIVLKRLPHHFFVAVQSIITPRPFNSSAFFFEHFSHRNSGAQSCVEITITRQAMYPRAILLQSTQAIFSRTSPWEASDWDVKMNWSNKKNIRAADQVCDHCRDELAHGS